MIILIKAFPPPLDKLYPWQPGDHITHLDGRPVEDIIDLYYYTPETDETVLNIRRQAGEMVRVVMDPEDIAAVTGCFAPMEFKTCACDCVFCFIDQNPAGMRDQIYVKDEDYRFSFLYGNYITMTSLGKKGLQRIIEQKMSPLYVSVHATDIDVRTRMLGIKRRIDIMGMLAQLQEAGIEVHTQVVLCPGWNDGPILEKTFRDLLTLGAVADEDTLDVFDPEAWNEMPPGRTGGVRSLAIVPVGLSAHRKGLTRLDPVEEADALRAIRQVRSWQEEALGKLSYRFVYLSDEFYLKADRPFPAPDDYDGFWQVDNAIGLTPRLRENWAQDLQWAAEENALPRQPLTVLTSHLAAHAWHREFTPQLEAAGAPPVDVIGVDNRFYGNSVTVAGLLTGGDLRRGLLALPADPVRTVALSPRVFNAEDLTLDGMTLADIAAGQPHRVVVAEEEGFVDFWAELD
jgi:putative radical SAM enzyme (TIGR03279 family)